MRRRYCNTETHEPASTSNKPMLAIPKAAVREVRKRRGINREGFARQDPEIPFSLVPQNSASVCRRKVFFGWGVNPSRPYS